MVSGHACVRVQKMALPLLERGHNVHLIAYKTPSFYESYDTFLHAAGTRQYLEAIKLYEPIVDIWHCHNEPSWFVSAIKEYSDKPVILDVHDSHLVRVTPDEADKMVAEDQKPLRVAVEERNNFQLADGLIFVSEPFADIIRGEFALSQPSLVLPSYVPNFLMQYQAVKKQWLGGLVYEGRVDMPDDVKPGSENHGYRYCDYYELAMKLRNRGIDFHIYSGRSLSSEQKFYDLYKDYAVLHNGRNVKNLLAALQRHDWGLVGNIEFTPDWDIALPNKLFEYIAAGVPIVAINAAHCSEIIEKAGIGITVKSVNELADRWPEHREMRRNLPKARKAFRMEEHIAELEGFYRGFL